MNSYILEMKNIRKTFLNGKVVANDDITLKIKKGEIHSLVGEIQSVRGKMGIN